MTNNTFRNPSLYTTDRGLSKEDQLTPLKVKSVDSSWLKASVIEGYKGGVVVNSDTYQKFIPYQSSYETFKHNQWGIVRQDTSTLPWSNNTRELYQWKTDIFGNQYGLYKDFTNSTIYDRKSRLGEIWVATPNGNIEIGTTALSGIFSNYNEINTTVFSELSSSIVDMDIFFDTLMLVTPTHITLDKILVDYQTGRINSIADNIQIISLQDKSFAGTWFFEAEKSVSLCTVEEGNGYVLVQIYDYDLNKNSFRLVFSENVIIEGIENIGIPLFSYNSDIGIYNVSFTYDDKLISINIKTGGSTLSLDSVVSLVIGDMNMLIHRPFGTQNNTLIVLEDSNKGVHINLIVDNQLIPIKLEYPYDQNSTLNASLSTVHSDVQMYEHAILNNIKDISINKGTLMILTKDIKFFEIITFDSQQINRTVLELKTQLRIENQYVTMEQGFMFADHPTSGSLFRFVQDGNYTKIWNSNKVLTLGSNNEVYFSDELIEDPNNTQKFLCTFTNRLTITTVETHPRTLGRNSSTSIIEANNSLPNQFEIFVSPDFNTNYDGKLYFINYYGDLASGENKTVAIDPINSIENIPRNMLVFAPYKSAIVYDEQQGLAVMKINFCNLKNFLTPEHKYPGKPVGQS